MLDATGKRRQFGNLVLARYPVIQIFRHLLPWPADAAVPSMQRVAVEVVLAAPFGPVRVTTTHLEYYSQMQRRQQVNRLRELHAEAFEHRKDQNHVAEGRRAVPDHAAAGFGDTHRRFQFSRG